MLISIFARVARRLLRVVATVAILFLALMSMSSGSGVFSVPAAAADPPMMLPLTAANPRQKVLAIADGGEADQLRTSCRQLGIAVDVEKDFSILRRDYSPYHAVVSASNRMDYFGSPETQVPEAFQPVVDWVAAGGHLLMFGTYHGRNMEHLKRFDIVPYYGGGGGFIRIPYASDALFAGVEQVLPQDSSLTFIGRLTIQRPHVLMLHRGDGDPGVATVAFGDGRITIMMVEPFFKKEYWLLHVILAWHHRGAPTRLVENGLFGVATAVDTASRLAIPAESAVTARIQGIHTELEDAYRRLKPWNAAIAKELSRNLLARSEQAETPLDRYALLVEAREIAIKSGDSAMVLNTIERGCRVFAMDPLSTLRESLNTTATTCRTASDCRSIVDVSIMGAYEAINAQQLDTADELLTLAGSNVRRARVPELGKQITTMKQTVRDARKTSGK